MNTIAESFRNKFAAELRTHSRSDSQLLPFLEEVEKIDCAAGQVPPAWPEPQTVTNYLAPALRGLRCSPELAEAIRPLAGAVSWYQLFEGEGIEPDLAKGLTAGQLAGQVGLVAADTIRAGLFLLAPGVHYPLHQHGALELYFVVSGVLTLQHHTTGAAFEVAAGNWSVTPSNRVHSLTTGDAPVMVIYAWIGEVESPNWWWVEKEGGVWERVCWQRQPDAKWIQTHSEAITDEIWEEAGEPG